MSRIVSDVKMPKLSACYGFRWRALRRATVASSMAAFIKDTSFGFTVIDRLLFVRGASAAARIEHDGAGELAVPLDGAHVVHSDPRVVSDLVEFLVAARDRELLNVERVGAGLVENRLLHRRVQALDQR